MHESPFGTCPVGQPQVDALLIKVPVLQKRGFEREQLSYAVPSLHVGGMIVQLSPLGTCPVGQPQVDALLIREPALQ